MKAGILPLSIVFLTCALLGAHARELRGSTDVKLVLEESSASDDEDKSASRRLQRSDRSRRKRSGYRCQREKFNEKLGKWCWKQCNECANPDKYNGELAESSCRAEFCNDNNSYSEIVSEEVPSSSGCDRDNLSSSKTRWCAKQCKFCNKDEKCDKKGTGQDTDAECIAKKGQGQPGDFCAQIRAGPNCNDKTANRSDIMAP